MLLATSPSNPGCWFQRRSLTISLLGAFVAVLMLGTLDARPAAGQQPGNKKIRAVAAALAEADGPDEGEPETAIGNPFKARRKAPSLDGGTAWINVAGPIELKQLRGKFVLLDFWTYCCINCMHILPVLKKLEHAYPNNLVVIGVHSAKFETERDCQEHHRRRAPLRSRASGD